jgi:arabinofuranan 3-O-arabinosyltransferase
MKFWRGTSSRLLKAEDLIFSHRRLSVFGYSLLLAWVGAFTIRFFSARWLFDRAGHPTFVDFIQWFVGGKFARMRDAAGAYNYSAFSAAQTLVTKSIPPITYFPWVYPPTMLLLVAPIARLPYAVAFFVWLVGTFCLYAVALYTILPDLLAIVLALLPLPVINNVFNGQTAFLTAGLLGLSLAFASRRPYPSGICLGILTYKPQFVLFFPLALVITRQWRVIAGATASALLFAGAASLMFGSGVWLLFMHSLRGHNSGTLLPVNLEGVNQTVFGLMHEAGAGPLAAWVVHLAVALFMTMLACYIWQRPVPHALKGAAFSIGVLTATPYMLLYDLTAVSIPAAFLVADAVARGFLPGERFTLLGCFLALYLCLTFAAGPIVLLALMGLVIRRAMHGRTTSAAIVTTPP